MPLPTNHKYFATVAKLTIALLVSWQSTMPPWSIFYFLSEELYKVSFLLALTR